ncbi:MAG: hypothetical protein KKB74_04865 [Bacteroidetes bacterium]|nr:hypothetical protein [Bacteroidota bacterium]
MRRFFNISLIIFTASWIMVSCTSSAESKLIGTWKAQKVETDFDENKLTPDMISQVVEMQKQTYFRMVNDSVMTIISKNNTHEAKWSFNKETQTVTYYFNGMGNIPSILGKFTEGKIVSESKTPMGKITIYYEKE